MKKLFRYKVFKMFLNFVPLCFCASVPGVFVSLCLANESEFIQLTVVTHVHSSFSHDGVKSLEYWVQEAEKFGIDVFIPTDTALARWEYGIWPFRGIIKKVVEKPSVLSLGPEQYLGAIKYLQEKHPRVIIIPGMEAACSYWWKGFPLIGRLLLKDWSRHMLIIGLESADDYLNLPVLSNRRARKINFVGIAIVIVILSILIIKPRFFMVACFVAAVLYFYPFRYYDINPYKGDPGYKPYQKLIDYVKAKGGLIFWAHPEAVNWAGAKPVGNGLFVETKPYPEAILKTVGYTGFAYWWEGYREVGSIGGQWDQVLTEYVYGKRKSPSFAIAELDIGAGGHSSADINSLQMILWAKERSGDAVMDALSKGRFYIINHTAKKSPVAALKEYYVETGGRKINSGEGGTANGSVNLHLLFSSAHMLQNTNIDVVKNGKFWKNIAVGISGSIVIKDIVAAGEPVYYRTKVNENSNSVIITNPIFLNRRGN